MFVIIALFITVSTFAERYYDPEVGVWTSVDPVHQFHSPYSYDNNPINTIDPDGNASIKISAGGSAVATAGGGVDVDIVNLNINALLDRWGRSGLPGAPFAKAGAMFLDAVEKFVFFDKTPNSLDPVLKLGDGSYKILAGTAVGAWAELGISGHIGETGDIGAKMFGQLSGGLGLLTKIGLTFDLPQNGEEFGGWGIGGGLFGIANAGAPIGGGTEISGDLWKGVKLGTMNQ